MYDWMLIGYDKSTKKEILIIMPPTLYWWLFWMIVWKSREEVNTAWTELGSFFTMVLTAITDTKDWKAIKIKTDPAYLHDSDYWVREEATTQWKVRFRS